MTAPIVFGFAQSVYVRSVRLALEEKGVAYRLEEINPFAPEGPPASHMERQPFGKVPAFEHDGFALYETDAILRYVDEVFSGAPLIPATPRDRARMTQVMRILDNYVYPSMVWGVFVEEVRKPQHGEAPDEDTIAASLQTARTCLTAIDDLRTPGRDYLVGDRLSLADLHAVPMFIYFAIAPRGAELLRSYPGLIDWLARMKARPSVIATTSPLEQD